MNKEILEAVTGEVRELLEAGSCCKEAKDAARRGSTQSARTRRTSRRKSWSPSWKRTSCQLMD